MADQKVEKNHGGQGIVFPFIPTSWFIFIYNTRTYFSVYNPILFA